jgi:serine/threonine protein kinase
VQFNQLLAEDRAKTFVGTPQYMAPELLEASETSKRSDPPSILFKYFLTVSLLAALICGLWDA